MTEEPEKEPVSAQDFKDAIAHAIELLKRVTTSYIIVGMPDNDDLGPMLEFYGEMDEVLGLNSRAEAILHDAAIRQMRPQIEHLGQVHDQVRGPEVG